jgi:phosphoserine phosphatase RsbU/P
VIGTFQQDLPALVVGVALCTIAVGLSAFTFLGRRIANIDLPIAGAFAAAYGLRLILRTSSVIMAMGDPPSLHYVHAALEYIVPIPASFLFVRLFGDRMRFWNRLAVIFFVVYAVVAIPYEIAVGHPGALHAPHSALVVLFVVFFLFNIAFARLETQDGRILRFGSVLFALYVLNSHFRLVSAPFALASEPVGFLIFIAGIVYTLIRHTVRTQMRVASVNGELAAARQIQMSILPKAPPPIRGLDLEAIYAPASEVAGDFYDFVPIDERSVGILVADVSGHGVPAALVASMLKVAVAGHTELARQPARLLQELNGFFCGKLERQFITACYALIEGEEIKIASAGHPAPLLVRGNRTVEEITADGALIGRFRDARFSERSVPIRSGDRLVVYTDGITEALSAGGEMWGEERFHQSLAAGARAQQILDAVKSWSSMLQDDVTLVVARRV